MSLAPRCYCADLEKLHEAVSDHERHHLLHVLRLRAGDAVLLFDGKGRHRLASITLLDKKQFVLESTSAIEVAPQLSPCIFAALAIPKHDAWHEQLALCVALGVSVIQPIVSERVEMRIGERGIEEKMSKWERVLIESAKQCASFYLPRLERPMDFEKFVELPLQVGFKLIASLEANARPLREYLGKRSSPDFAVLIGPEGDFSPREYGLASEHGYLPVSMGASILRCPVALTVLLSQIRYAFSA
jgi:16S rRNA (uracil1498-N3)-methyltransferase